MATKKINNTFLKKLERGIESNLSANILQNILRDLERFIYANPKNVRALTIYAYYQLKNSRPDLAGEASSRIVNLAPHNIEGQSLLLRCYAMVGDNQKALEIAKFLALETLSNVKTLEIVGSTLVFNEEYPLAKEVFERLTVIKPSNANYLTNLGSMHHYCNDAASAEMALIKACKVNPAEFRAYWLLSQLRPAMPKKNHIELFEKQLSHSDQRTDATSYLHFALAKEREDLKDFDTAFVHLEIANAAKFRSASCTTAQHKLLFSLIRNQYEQIITSVDEGHKSNEPIFIIGMPRSGTTLVEQVLGDDSKVFRAGERQEFYRAMCLQAGSRGKKWPLKEVIAASHTFGFQRLGQSYIDLTRPRTGHTPYFIDKMPENFLYLGFIHKALPNAKFIHISRDPLDTCLSNFKMLFGAEMYPYSYNLDTLAEYYLQYHELMKFWNDAFGSNIINIKYEDLVQDPNKEFSSIFKHCDLQWHSERLDYHDKNTAVGTASAAQVRQPIYTSSIQKWRKFEPHIEPLKTKLKMLDLI